MFLNSVIVTKRTYFCTCCFPCMSRYLFIPVSLKYIIFIVVLLEMPDANLLRCIIKLLRPPRVIYLQISISISGIILILSPAIRIVGRSPRFIRHNKDEVYHYHLSVANYEFCWIRLHNIILLSLASLIMLILFVATPFVYWKRIAQIKTFLF